MYHIMYVSFKHFEHLVMHLVLPTMHIVYNQFLKKK